MNISKYSIFLILISSITIGTVWATSTFDDDGIDEVDGSLPVNVVDGVFVTWDTDGTGVANTLRSIGGATIFQFIDDDDPDQVYRIKLLADGSEFQIRDFTNNRTHISIETSSGDMCLGSGCP